MKFQFKFIKWVWFIRGIPVVLQGDNVGNALLICIHLISET